MLAKVFLWLETHNPRQDWRACLVFASRSLAPSDTSPYRELLESGRVQSIFLDERAEPAADQIGLGILELIACPAALTLTKATTWVQRVRDAKRSMADRRRLIELIEMVVLGRLPGLGRKELEHMLQLADVRESKVFAEGVEEGAQQALEQVALRMLAQGDSVAEIAKMTGLPVARVKKLKNRKTTGR